VLDSKKSEFNIDNYGIAITTMDEVFLQVAIEAKERE
jgi:uncharacterized DUF497 family protein